MATTAAGRPAPPTPPRDGRRPGRNRYHASRLTFARTLLDRPGLGPERILTMELYPWHSTTVTASMSPPLDVLERFVWAPLREMPLDYVFAFTALQAEGPALPPGATSGML